MLTPEQQERVDKLFSLGLKYDGSSMTYHDINFHWTDIVCMSKEEFDRAYEGAVRRKAVIDK